MRVINGFFTYIRIVGRMSKRARKANVTISVNNNIERALRQFRKKLDREGVSRDAKRKVYFESPTAKRRKRYLRAVKQNWIRMATSKLI
jgi:ribosomal protein S21